MPINEKTHPIENAWVKKMVIYHIIGGIFGGGFIYLFLVLRLSERKEELFKNTLTSEIGVIVYIMLCFGFIIVNICKLILNKMNLHYSFGETDIVLKQGIMAKSERQTLYGRIQDIKIAQDLVDKYLGIASLMAETASAGGGAALLLATKNKNKAEQAVGFVGAPILIPGLSYKNAQDLKNFIMERIKANPIDDAHSGL